MLLGMRSALLSGVAFTPAALFASGEQGVWYDPSDFSTLFQDSAGTIPVTAVEQPVGFMADIRKNAPINPILQKYGSLPGTSGNSFSTPDSVANSITGDIDVRALVALNDWTPTSTSMIVAKWDASSVNRSYLFYIAATTGFITVAVSPDGTSVNGTSFSSTVAPTVSDGALLWVRATVDVNNGSGGKTAVFYTSSDGSTWVQLGSSVTVAGTTSIFNSSAIVTVGSTNLTGDNFAGRIYRAQIYNGINGTLAVDFCPPYNWTSGTWNSATTGETWTVNTSGSPAATVVSLTTGGNHATQTTSAARPTLSARVNLLTKTEQFDDAAWTKTNATAVATSATNDPLGGTTAEVFTANVGTGSVTDIFQNATLLNSTSYKAVIYVKKNTHDFVQIRHYTAVGGATRYANFNVASGVLGTVGANATAAITDAGNGWWLCQLTATVTGTAGGFDFYLIPNATAASAPSWTRLGTESVYIWGAGLRVANDTALPVYQRVNTATDYDATGFPYYLRFDGTDDSMATASINFTATAQMSVFAGLRKLSDAARGVLMEMGISSFGAVQLNAPVAASDTINFSSTGSTGTANATATGYTAPVSAVITGSGDILADISQLRVNGVQVATSSTDQGSGNYGNHILYIGRRGGTTLPFNGRIYSLIVRGAATSETQIGQTETWVNGKTKAY